MTLKVGRFDEIAIDDANAADPRAHEKIGGGGADRSAAGYHGAGCDEAFLTGQAEASKKDLAGIFFAEKILHG